MVFPTLGDLRSDVNFIELIDRVSNRMSLNIRKVSDGRAEEVRFGRFLRNSEICLDDMIQMGVDYSLADISDRHVLLVQDTSELSFGLAPFQRGFGRVAMGMKWVILFIR